ncbi:hypothetical protein F3I27_23250 [Pantoea sp. Bo_2]|nr:hypothetical protein F3I36_23490 [Pantoea sp. FN_2b]KAA6044185.1 hypothetical protein F3I34_23260 [Pantoea sp. Bo_5]KAA6053102.1 hypothetical protein F3I32_23455 [Pantoea sp. Bo_40]KAA6053163.1 hypothetical protein F3I33_23255 [Pantoea sp. Bo_46]KAA6057117.1 hypothetical protein F3I29_23285 [Pantoea sp. Bo_3]KAA6066651.1 hypothetical protein F3I28_23265 [Pantoea sp. Bo_21]KAA6067497.1 hypothetical protein F3I27_23250 [Pantoea sp. Bo_2]KAA6070392.1 hypothetical protein F3I31_23280 [Pantoea
MTTFICIASGPSLTAGDCRLATASGHPVIVVNSCISLAPDCDHLFAADCSWWDKYHSTLKTRAQCWTVSGRAHLRYGVNLFRPPDNDSFNSGQRAMQLAAHLGAERIILLGYDCSLANGTHWHGEHPDGLKNPDSESIRRWQSEFQRLADSLPSVSIINCSRHTSLTRFPRAAPEEVL